MAGSEREGSDLLTENESHMEKEPLGYAWAL